ncbi:hypothetical protein BHM03_00046632 [Ensete ventricosum]|nr:hypothetical protein BHM03_00046632 [Ensete ventricosum]
MKTRREERDQTRYYHFHRYYGHDTEECHDLKNQIEDLIHRGHLNRYVRKPSEPSPHPKGPVEKLIDIIIGGLASSQGGGEYLFNTKSLRAGYSGEETQAKE